MLEKWVLKLFGSPMTSIEVQERIRYNRLCRNYHPHHCAACLLHTVIAVKNGMGFPYSLPSVGPGLELIPVYRQSAHG